MIELFCFCTRPLCVHRHTVVCLSCRLDCEWSDQSIVILESVRIDPPYTEKEVRSLDGDKAGLDRALLMVRDRDKALLRAQPLCRSTLAVVSGTRHTNL